MCEWWVTETKCTLCGCVKFSKREVNPNSVEEGKCTGGDHTERSSFDHERTAVPHPEHPVEESTCLPVPPFCYNYNPNPNPGNEA